MHQIEFVSYAMGKPKSDYPDAKLYEGHKNLKLTILNLTKLLKFLKF